MRLRLPRPALLALALLLAACGEPAPVSWVAPARGADGFTCADLAPLGGRVRLATTTSTQDSGLLEHLLGPFEARTGLRVEVIAVGTGHALALGRRGDADVVLVHDRAREDAFVAEGHATARHDVMHNDFVLLGPAADPAGIRGGEDAATALLRIAAADALFVSRGDDSGTHGRERALWAAAGGRPAWDGYLEAGQGMGPCLVIADEKRAYVLADRGTWLAFCSRLDLEVLVEGDPALHNPYGIMPVSPDHHPHVDHAAARCLVRWVTSAPGRRLIGGFRVAGEPLFHPARRD